MRNKFAQSVQHVEAELELFVQNMKFMTGRELDYVTQKSALTYILLANRRGNKVSNTV